MTRRRPQASEPTIDVEALIASLDQEGEPIAVRSWTEGERCVTRGQLGRVEALGPGCVAVVTDGCWLFVAIEELAPIV